MEYQVKDQKEDKVIKTYSKYAAAMGRKNKLDARHGGSGRYIIVFVESK